jgi:hypothetical protein
VALFALVQPAWQRWRSSGLPANQA